MICSNCAARANSDIAQDLCAGTENHIIFDRRVALALVESATSQGDAMINGYIIANDGGFTDDNSHPMVDKDATADSRAGVDLNSGARASVISQQASNKAAESAINDQATPSSAPAK